MKTLFCLHGLGSSSGCFTALRQTEALAEYAIVTPDCAGHNQRPHDVYHGDPLTFAAEEIIEQIEMMQGRVGLIGHSMGGILAMLIAQRIPERIHTLISLEGNLIDEDCGMLSRRLASCPHTDDAIPLKESFINWARQSPAYGWQQWAHTVSDVAPQTLMDYALSMVFHSDSGQLIETFNGFPSAKAYIYGDDYMGHPVLQRLSNVTTYPLKGCSHFMMQDDANACAEIIHNVVRSGFEAD